MRLATILLSLLVSACPRTDPSAAANPPPVVTVPAATQSAATAPAATPDPGANEAVLIGTVHRLGTKICKSIDSADWQDIHVRAGLVRLEGNVQGLEAQRESGVILFGSVIKEGKPELPRDPGTCLPIQSRSDWIDTPDGVILRRDGGPSIAAFRVRTSKRLESLSARLDGEQVAVALENPLAVALDSFVITVHYEGCYGKPLTHAERREVGRLQPKSKHAVSVPALVRKTIGSRDNLLHHATSVQIEAHAPQVYFDLDVRLAKLGVETSCPKR